MGAEKYYKTMTITVMKLKRPLKSSIIVRWVVVFNRLKLGGCAKRKEMTAGLTSHGHLDAIYNLPGIATVIICVIITLNNKHHHVHRPEELLFIFQSIISVVCYRFFIVYRMVKNDKEMIKLTQQ